nr:unnamed protein product [Digitaria exilis]
MKGKLMHHYRSRSCLLPHDHGPINRHLRLTFRFTSSSILISGSLLLLLFFSCYKLLCRFRLLSGHHRRSSSKATAQAQNHLRYF